MGLSERLGIIERTSFSTKLLSGGEKQRVACARALLNRPDIVFADEPTGNLDPSCAAEIHQLLFKYVEEEKKSLVVVTHNLELASLCSRQYELRDGKLESV